MSQHLTFYTVDLDKPGFPVRYMRPGNDWRIERLAGPHNDPGEASQEFQRSVTGEHCYLDNAAFRHKAAALAKLRRSREQVTV